MRPADHSSPVRRAVRLVRAAAGPAVLGVLLIADLQAPPQPSAAVPATGPSATTTVIASCGPGTDTGSGVRAPDPDTRAMVRTPSGEVRVVSFEYGWAVYNGRAPGTFLRVCRT